MSGSVPISVLGADEVHVWWIDLESIADSLLGVLSPEERTSAERFRQPRNRARWVAARASLRQVMAKYAGVPAASLRLERGPWGKPALAGGSPLHFNLTYTGQRAALAIARDREVGIDLEPIDPELDVSALLAVACSHTEALRIGALPPVARPEAFLTCWTLKEAYLKGIGTGLSQDPRAIDIAMLPDGGTAVFDTGAELEGRHWSARLLDAGPGWIAAVATPGPAPAVTVYQWPPRREIVTGG